MLIPYGKGDSVSMSSGTIIVYCLVNILLGIVLHTSFRHSSLAQPKRGELLVYSLLFLIAGLPMVFCAFLYALARSVVQHHHQLHHG